MITEEAIIELNELWREHWNIVNFYKKEYLHLNKPKEEVGVEPDDSGDWDVVGFLRGRAPNSSSDATGARGGWTTWQPGQIEKIESYIFLLEFGILRLIGKMARIDCISLPLGENEIRNIYNILSPEEMPFDVFIEDRPTKKDHTRDLKIIASQIYQFITKKQLDIRFYKKQIAASAGGEIVVDLMRTAIENSENHIRAMTKILWRIGKDETWWEEKKEGDYKTSSDDLKQYYDVLESIETDSPKEIKAKFRELIKFYHPDNFQNNPEKRAFAEKKTKEITNAYDKLHKCGIL